MLDKDVLKTWTIGHSTRTIDDFLCLLNANNIEAVADVRSFPVSRRYPHFNAETLGETLKENGIKLVPLKKLGGRRRAHPDSKNTIWRSRAFRGYADYMETPEFMEGMHELIKISRRKRTAVMCAEAVWWRCHRSMISDHLKASGVIVEHIIGERKTTPHPYTAAARFENGKLTYGAA
jgi:uncharacterized protein (DUF488 family)